MEIRNKILEFIKCEIVDGLMNIRLDYATNLIESGVIDSMGIMKLLVFVEETFNWIRLPDCVREPFGNQPSGLRRAVLRPHE